MSLTSRAGKIGQQAMAILRRVDTASLTQAETVRLQQIRRYIREVKAAVRDYEFAETRTDQLREAAAARWHLRKLEALLLGLGFMIDAADIAQLSAEIDAIYDALI